MSAGWTWGFDHLHRLPVWTPAALLALAILVWTRAGRRALGRGAEAVGARLEAAPLRVAILVAILAVAAFALLPIATRIYGDSRYILDDYSPANLSVHIEKMMSLGLLARGRAGFVLHDLVSRLTGLSYERSYMLVSILCGGIFIFAHARLAARLPAIGGRMRAAILCIGLTDGANQLFFGHVENYTLPRLFGSLFLIGVVESLAKGPPRRIRALPLLWFLLAVFFHSQTLVLLPALLLWIASAVAERRPAFRDWAGRQGLVAGLGAMVGILAIAYLAYGSICYDYIYSGGRPHPRQLFLPITTECVGLPYLRYTLFSWAHIADFFGSLYSISSPAVLFALVTLLPAARRDPRLLILIPAIAAAALHNFILNPAIGYPFDWDLMCVLSPPLLYTAVFLLWRQGKVSAGALPALLVLGLATASLFLVNASPDRVRGRVEEMGVWLHRTYYGGSHYRLSANHSTIADVEAQAEDRLRVLKRLAPQTYGDDREVAFLWEKLAMLAIQLEDWHGALDAYREALAAEPSRWDRSKPLGYLETEVGVLPRGIFLLESYLERAPADPEAWLLLGDARASDGDREPAIRAWSRFLDLAPDDPEAGRVRAMIEAARAGAD